LETFVCLVCNHVAFDNAPVDCPVCGAAIENYENVPRLLRRPADRENLTPEEETHVPLIIAKKDCDLHRGKNCIYIEVRVGHKEHVTEPEHFVDFVDAYLDKRYIGRLQWTSYGLAPAGCFHLLKDTGSLRVVSRCNRHGFWTSRIKLEDVLLKS
jgi:desulfoferrodoxin (superoxide reductase-like protein)